MYPSRRAGRTSKLLPVLCLLLPLAVGCSKSESAAASGPTTVTASAGDEVMAGRKQIQTAEMSLTVASYADARAALERTLEAREGYVEGANVQHDAGGGLSASLVLRVPAKDLAPTMRQLAELGELRHEVVNRQDVTEAYADTDARLISQRALEKRLLALAAGETQTVADLLEVERELARVRGEIEQLDAKKRGFDGAIEMSELRVQLRELPPTAAKNPLVRRAQETLMRSGELVADTGALAVLVAAALLPWLPLAAAVVLALRFFVRWASRRPVPAHAGGAIGPVDRMSITSLTPTSDTSQSR